MIDIAPGLLLISDPFLKDPNFSRSVVLICDHQSEGSFGFVLNKPYESSLGKMLDNDAMLEYPLFYGGPVQVDTIHYLHKRPDLIDDSMEVMNNIFWGGNFELVTELLKEKQLSATDIKFFIGYSGWGEGQLKEELATKNWITRQASSSLVFHKNFNHIWKDALIDLGGEYSQMINYPLDPQYN
ncbi:MAG: YqgE/AlgH family protein [Chitinophagaceae bacterium]|nr:YqgE/AlgH family protein [Chitinophagaceae bacterium]MCW5905867.1 YqgE/AlgH family protein [Chitinophagaceae bacterium]